MLSKLWATYEMNFWERKVYVDFTDKRFGTTQINPPTNVAAKIRLI